MGNLFSETLCRLRKSEGFPTAYRFFHDNGGAPVLKVSYRKYLLMEQGKYVPDMDRIRRLVFALRLSPGSTFASELVCAWLRTVGNDDAFEYLIAPMLDKDRPQSLPSPLHKALKRSLVQAKFYVSPKQLEVMAESRDTYLCYLALSNDTGRWTPAALGEALKMAEPAARRSMAKLAGAGLLKEIKKGLYKCPLAEAMLEFPHMNTVPHLYERLRDLQRELIDKGVEIYIRRGLLRVDTDEFHHFFALLSLNLSTAQTYAVTRKTRTSALYAVESRAVKLLDF